MPCAPSVSGGPPTSSAASPPGERPACPPPEALSAEDPQPARPARRRSRGGPAAHSDADPAPTLGSVSRSRPAAGGGRRLRIPPERLGRWLDGVAERHGSFGDVHDDDGVLRITCADST